MEARVMQPKWRKKYMLADMTLPTVENWLQRTDTILIPSGSIEQHGPHSPMATDWYQALLVACAAAERAEVPVSPGLQYGPTPFHLGRPGAISLRDETFYHVMYDICRSLVHHGWNRIITVVCHLPNQIPMIRLARKIKDTTGALVVTYVPYFYAEQDAPRLFGVPVKEFHSPPRHAGELETGGVMAWNRELIEMDRAEPGQVHTPSWLTPAFTADSGNQVVFKGYTVGLPSEHYEFSDTGVIGNPVVTQEQADECYRTSIDYLVDLIQEVRKIKLNVHHREFTDRS